MAVADIFSAITEDRPYRKGMPTERVISILEEDVERGKPSASYVGILKDNYDLVNARREQASRKVGTRYYELMEQGSDIRFFKVIAFVFSSIYNSDSQSANTGGGS